MLEDSQLRTSHRTDEWAVRWTGNWLDDQEMMEGPGASSSREKAERPRTLQSGEETHERGIS